MFIKTLQMLKKELTHENIKLKDPYQQAEIKKSLD